MKKIKLLILSIIITTIIGGCKFFGAGTLGGFNAHKLDLSESQLKQSIGIFYNSYPQYKIPDKWKDYDSWSKRGYDFLNGQIFYFNSAPEEMYYVTFRGDSINPPNYNNSIIAVRAVCRGNSNWLLNSDLKKEEIDRIEKRFDKEIVSKLY